MDLENEQKLGNEAQAWRITGTLPSSRSTVDVYFGEKTVRIPGELMFAYFLACPYGMFWLAKEDRDLWPWKLPPERETDTLSEEEQSAVMAVVMDYCRHRKDKVVFLTKELEDRALELAELVRSGQLSRWEKRAQRKASALLKQEFPGLPDVFYKSEIIDSLAGVRWFGESDPPLWPYPKKETR